MEGQELKDISTNGGCDCPVRTPWVNLVAKKYAGIALQDEIIEGFEQYYLKREKFNRDVINDAQGAYAKIIFLLLLANHPSINWDEIKDTDLQAKIASVWNIAAMIPDALVPPQNP